MLLYKVTNIENYIALIVRGRKSWETVMNLNAGMLCLYTLMISAIFYLLSKQLILTSAHPFIPSPLRERVRVTLPLPPQGGKENGISGWALTRKNYRVALILLCEPYVHSVSIISPFLQII
jgi:hypothetical protein